MHGIMEYHGEITTARIIAHEYKVEILDGNLKGEELKLLYNGHLKQVESNEIIVRLNTIFRGIENYNPSCYFLTSEIPDNFVPLAYNKAMLVGIFEKQKKITGKYDTPTAKEIINEFNLFSPINLYFKQDAIIWGYTISQDNVFTIIKSKGGPKNIKFCLNKYINKMERIERVSHPGLARITTFKEGLENIISKIQELGIVPIIMESQVNR